jgi:hypothetical protein
MMELRKLMTAMAAAATLAACSGGDDNGTQPTPAMSIALSASTLSVQAGSNGTVNLTLTRTGGFTGDVAVTFDGLPTGVTAAAAPATIGAAATSSVITLTAAANATPATTNVTVKAAGTGVTTQTATLALTVTAAPAQGFSIAAGSPTISVAQGANNSAQIITVTRTGGFTGAVTFAAEGLPTGVTAAFNPASTTGPTSTLTLTAAANATVGNATVTVRGTATGQTDKTTTFTLTVTAASAGTYTLAVTPATLSVQQGANGTANIALTRTGGFAGSVALTVEGLPNGVAGTFNPANTTADASVLTLAVGAAVPAGNTTVTVRGTAAGQTDKTATFTLTVSAAPAGNYTLAASPTALSVAQGATINSTITITRTNGFAGQVSLSATGLPNGVTATFNPSITTGNTSTVTFTATASAVVGQVTVTIRGNTTGLNEVTTTLTLNVTATTGGSGNTTWEFCNASSTPIWFAVQDGATGTWTRVNPTGTKFQFNVTQPKAGIAYVTSSASGSVSNASQGLASRLSASLQRQLLLLNRPTRTSAYAARAAVESFNLVIQYGSQAELNNSGTTNCLPGSGKTVNGTVAGVNAASGQSATVSLGPSSASASGGTFQLKNVPDGALDLIGTRSTVNLTTFSFATDKLIIRRAVNAANNSTLPVLDFGSAEAFDPVQPNLTINNIGTDVAAAFTFYFTSAGSSASGATLGFGTPTTGPFKYFGVPAAKQANGDLHLMFVDAFPSTTQLDQGRVAGLYFKDAVDRTVTLGPALNAPTVSTAATTPYVRFRATAPLQSQYNQFIELSFSQANTTVSRSVAITATPGYLSGLTTYDFTVPDFSAVAGWDNNWGPKVGIATNWTITAVAATGTGFGTSAPVEGSAFTAGTRSGTITP